MTTTCHNHWMSGCRFTLKTKQKKICYGTKTEEHQNKRKMFHDVKYPKIKLKKKMKMLFWLLSHKYFNAQFLLKLSSMMVVLEFNFFSTVNFIWQVENSSKWKSSFIHLIVKDFLFIHSFMMCVNYYFNCYLRLSIRMNWMFHHFRSGYY